MTLLEGFHQTDGAQKVWRVWSGTFPWIIRPRFRLFEYWTARRWDKSDSGSLLKVPVGSRISVIRRVRSFLTDFHDSLSYWSFPRLACLLGAHFQTRIAECILLGGFQRACPAKKRGLNTVFWCKTINNLQSFKWVKERLNLLTDQGENDADENEAERISRDECGPSDVVPSNQTLKFSR